MLGFVFNRTCCLALTWNAARQCRGLRVRRTGDSYVVENSWAAQVTEGQTLGSCLAAGLRALGCDETCTIAVGPTVVGWGFADLLLPQLPPADLAKALAFELTRQLPLPREKFAWGYRLLPATPATPGQRPVRVVYLRGEEWQSTLNELASLTPGADLILPPAACLDPVLADRPVLLPGDSGQSFVAAPGASGGREVVMAGPDAGECFGALPQPLAAASITLADNVAALTPPEQQEHVGCLLLALYSLGRTVRSDQRTLLAVPRDLRVRRNRAGRITALFLGLYLLAILAVLAGQYFVSASRQYASLRAEEADLKTQIGHVKEQKNVWTFLHVLENEFKAVNLDKPALAVCLLDMTHRIPSDAWVQSFSWNEGKIEIDLRTANNNLDLVGLLEASPYLSDVVPLRKAMDPDGQVSLRLQMVAVYEPPTAATAATAAAAAAAIPAPPPPPPSVPPPPAPPADTDADTGLGGAEP